MTRSTFEYEEERNDDLLRAFYERCQATPEALTMCGERGEGQVFKKLTPNLVPAHLKDWIEAAGITKHITFHCFRHTFATLQLAAGTTSEHLRLSSDGN